MVAGSPRQRKSRREKSVKYENMKICRSSISGFFDIFAQILLTKVFRICHPHEFIPVKVFWIFHGAKVCRDHKFPFWKPCHYGCRDTEAEKNPKGKSYVQTLIESKTKQHVSNDQPGLEIWHPVASAVNNGRPLTFIFTTLQSVSLKVRRDHKFPFWKPCHHGCRVTEAEKKPKGKKCKIWKYENMSILNF